MFPVMAAIAIGLGSVAATGASPPKVSFSVAQATAGDKLYAAKCSAYQGANLEGGAGPTLSGATLTTLSKNTKLTVGDMFTFLPRSNAAQRSGGLDARLACIDHGVHLALQRL